MTDNTQTEALLPSRETLMAQAQVFASAWAIAGSSFDPGDGMEVAEQEKSILADMTRRLHARIAELEAQLEAIGAGGVSALMGAAKAGSEPVSWAIFAEGGNIRLWSKKPLLHPSAQPLYTHPSPTEGMAGWQPIETAPKDGTPLLLRSKKGRIADGAWITATSSCGGWAWAYVNLEPIEWQPLPVEPSMDGESNG